ncbi:MAG: DUF86 domain-containing protein [Candidatus Thorarchaeota archaeon]|nr:DUF86 domain-containing protein [Candidatus Thorarchaeota archaeon]
MSDSELKSRVLFLQEALRKLGEIALAKKEDFLAKYTLRDSALRNFQVVIECLTDIGNYMLRRGKQKTPETRAEVFQLLCRAGHLPAELENDLVEMARFRNLHVHTYSAVNLSYMCETLQRRLTFLKKVAALITRVCSSRP